MPSAKDPCSCISVFDQLENISVDQATARFRTAVLKVGLLVAIRPF